MGAGVKGEEILNPVSKTPQPLCLDPLPYAMCVPTLAAIMHNRCMRSMVYEEHDEDVQDAEAAEAPATREDRDSELRPMHHKQKEHGATPEEGEEDEGDDDDEVSYRIGAEGPGHGGRRAFTQSAVLDKKDMHQNPCEAVACNFHSWQVKVECKSSGISTRTTLATQEAVGMPT
eukprot:1156341-Pelagomonas_calceolata.AAC.2